MNAFVDLYYNLLRDTAANIETEEQEKKYINYDKNQLDCLLHPEKHPPVWRINDCTCEQQNLCVSQCNFDAINKSDNNVIIDTEKCTGCSSCIDHCNKNNLVASHEIIAALKSVRNRSELSYALVAPAFLGQFSKEVTPGKLRTALKKVGFDGMVEVSLFADILTLKESLEFDRSITQESDFMLTSCCCPIWIAMIRKIYSRLMPHVPGSVSPMIACGRTIKYLYPDAVTVFIGPCIAKKAEAKETDLAGAIDYVLTFEEINDIFTALDIYPSNQEESEKDHSSRSGRIYARTGGVSEAVSETLKRLNPDKSIAIKTKQADGVRACKIMVNELIAGNINANFFEGMGCVGGCVGGPKSIIDVIQGRENVNEYGNTASTKTPIDNPYVIELLRLLGFDTVESLLNGSNIFTRQFP